MTERTWIDPRCDRSTWPAGAWDGEPDKVQWKDESTGLACLAKRNPRMGFWCGYVGVAPDHPWHGKGCSEAIGEHLEHCTEDSCWGHSTGSFLDVHGGLTFADDCQEGPPEETVCHIPDPGEPDHLWWFGFDCGHCDDRSPQDEVFARDLGYPFICRAYQTYKPLIYVRAECARLAAQVKELRCD